ncbi:hypothetical protein [Paraburkholderia sp. A1RO-1]|uniref:hypothetical protein n=1 Tax=unclassified Paraburkholderia TaxID=2615204 RepID=UPI003B7AFB01
MRNAETAVEELKTRIRGEYGEWKLVELYSGAWAPIWYACFELENYAYAILEESEEFFNDEPLFEDHTPNPTYRTAHEALEKIVDGLQEELLNHPSQDAYYSKHIRNARRDLRAYRAKDDS